MPVIYSYPKGTSIIDSDSVLGTDQSNKNNTVTYTMVDIKDYVLKDLLDGVQFRLPIYGQPKVLTNSLFYQDTAADTGTQILGSTVYLNNGNNVGNLIVAQNITASDGNIVSTVGNIAAGGSIAAGQTSADPSYRLKVNGASKFTGSIIADNTLTVGGAATFNAAVQANSTVNVVGTLTASGTSNLDGIVRLGGAVPSSSTGIFLNRLTYLNSDTTLGPAATLALQGPIRDSSGVLGSNEQVLVSDANGKMSWQFYQSSGLEFQASWNASTDVPDLTSISLIEANVGKYWVVSVAGNTSLSGITDWQIGDWAIVSRDSSDTVFWSKIDNSAAITGTGTNGTLTKWTGPTTLGDSIVSESGTTLTIAGNTTTTGNLQLGQYNYLTFGDINNSDNLEISNQNGLGSSIVQKGLGNLSLYAYSQVLIAASGATGGQEDLARFKKDGPVELYYDNNKKFETTSTGITVTGTQSSFTGQVTIPTTPVAATDAASKAYVDSQAGVGSVTGDGNQYNIPVWSDTTELSGLTASTGLPSSNSLTAGISSLYQDLGAQGPGAVPTQHVIKNYNASGANTSTYTFNQSGIFTVSGDNGGRIDVGVNPANISSSALNVGTGVATFKGGVIISNSPGGVQVDNSSLVVGSGTNDNISGSDHCLIVGSGNQITSNSDQSVAFGQGNAITSSIDAFAVGNSNTLTSSFRTQALGFNNTITATSSFVAGGGNSINANSNIFALGDGHTVTTTGSTEDAYLIGTGNTITGGTGSFAIGSNLDGDTGNHMVVGYRNNKTSYPATDYSLGLGNTKFALAVGSTTTTNSNALLITEGGVNRGGGVAQVPRVLLPTIVGFNYANDTAAAAAGIPVGGLYHNAGVLRIRLT
jgi:hypothetical protein